jgi:Excreted virulence factor EspC, type VII ESX diderm
VSDAIKADTAWMRALAQQCDETAAAVQRQLGPAGHATDELRHAAPGWAFLGSLGEMRYRWEALNKLLRDELGKVAEDIRFAAGEYDWAEQNIGEAWRRLGGR